jgi:hypothetical protein
VLSWVAGTDGAVTESFFACAAGAFAAAPPIAALAVATDGRVPVVRVEEAREALGARVVLASAAGRVVRGRLVVVEGASDCRDVGFPGEALVVVEATGVLRTAGFRFSSPDVTEESSGSASEAVGLVVFLTAPGTARDGGLFRLDPLVPRRDVELVVGFDALTGVREDVVDTVGRRAGAVPLDVVVGRRGGTPSLLAFDAIFWRMTFVGVDGAGNFLGCCGLPG